MRCGVGWGGGNGCVGLLEGPYVSTRVAVYVTLRISFILLLSTRDSIEHA